MMPSYWTFPAVYTVNSDNEPWAYICSKGYFAGLIFGGNLFSEGLIIGRNFAFPNGLGLTIKTA